MKEGLEPSAASPAAVTAAWRKEGMCEYTTGPWDTQKLQSEAFTAIRTVVGGLNLQGSDRVLRLDTVTQRQ